MLRSLSIRDVVLIDRLDLEFEDGLMVLTGETGAGKSILLDALGLALGMRAEQRLVRHGTPRAQVTAAFDLATDHAAWDVLEIEGFDADPGEEMILRRVLAADGKSRAYLNDQPISIGLLRRLGDTLVEVHGQFESHRLLSASTHRVLLDSFGGLAKSVTATDDAFSAWIDAVNSYNDMVSAFEKAQQDEAFLRHSVGELLTLSPVEGEEAVLASQRSLMMHVEKLMEALNAASQSLSDGPGACNAVQAAVRHLTRVSDISEGRFDALVSMLDETANELTEVESLLDKAAGEMDMDPAELEKAEVRLFALRATARKHGVEVDGLPGVLKNLKAQLDAVEDGGASLIKLENAAIKAREKYEKKADVLTAARKKAAIRLDKGVVKELGPLKLGEALFETDVAVQDEVDWGPHGKDAVSFQVATNAGQPAGPLAKVASGGELARFMLALKVVLAQADPVTTLVFDEVDAGIGGATAAAVGERLARLAEDVQVLVVTHSPQVAARGVGHLKVAKSGGNGGGVATSVAVLGINERQEEIARMLAGAEVTDEARAAAQALLSGEAG